MLACKGTIFKAWRLYMISRIPELQLCTAFVLVWTQLGNIMLRRQNFILSWSREHHYLLEERWTRFAAWFTSHSTYAQQVYIERLCWSLNEFTLVCSDQHSSSIWESLEEQS